MEKPPHNFRDLTDQRFDTHSLTVLGREGINSSNQVLWRCRKDDGGEVLRTASYLNSYAPQRKPKAPGPLKPKALSWPPERHAWQSMVNRCSNLNHVDYGGRGISVCERWRASYEAFLEDMGPRPSSGHSLDRIDTEGQYEPANCRWATRAEQARNTRTSVYLEHDGLRLSLPDWAERLGVSSAVLHNRIKQGLPTGEVLSSERRKTPRRPRKGPNQRHGLTGIPEYQAWRAMMGRCTDPGHAHYPQYGARGIVVCDAWLSFDGFRSALGPCPEGLQLGRLDTSKGYDPENARWMTRTEAMRASNAAHLLEHASEAHPMAEWSDLRGIPVETIRSRLRLGWTVAQTLGFEPRKCLPLPPTPQMSVPAKGRKV